MTFSDRRRGDIWFQEDDGLDFDPESHITQGSRPVLVVSTSLHNATHDYVTVIPMTKNLLRATRDNNLFVPAHKNGLTNNSVALVSQVRPVQSNKLTRYVGSVNEDTMARIEDQLRKHLGIQEAE